MKNVDNYLNGKPSKQTLKSEVYNRQLTARPDNAGRWKETEISYCTGKYHLTFN